MQLLNILKLKISVVCIVLINACIVCSLVVRQSCKMYIVICLFFYIVSGWMWGWQCKRNGYC